MVYFKQLAKNFLTSGIIFFQNQPWKKISTFLVFLLLSVTFRLILMSQQSSSIQYALPIKYLNQPDSLLFIEELPTHLQINIQDKELTLFVQYITQSIWRKKDTIDIDLEPFLDKKSISHLQLMELIQLHFPKSVTTTDISPYSISLNNMPLPSKKIPVVFGGDIETKKNTYHLSRDISITPDSIMAYGTQQELNSLNVASTEDKVFKGVSSSIKATVEIASHGNIRFSPNKVSIFIPISEFVRHEFSIPITCESLPEHINAIFFPSTVTVSFGVPIDDIKNVHPEDFSIRLDYNDLLESTNNSAPLRLMKTPSYVRDISISPSEVEFLLEKRH